MTSSYSQVRFADLLQQAVSVPGTISSAYRQFHNYSLGNMLLAAAQCAERGIPFGPIATFLRWKELKRWVRKGEKAITLCQPIAIPRKNDGAESDEDAGVILRFTFRPHWFVLAQTEGESVSSVELAAWDTGRALAVLNVSETPFTLMNGNVMGYARAREIAINPINPFAHKTRFHEIGHVLLGHTAEQEQADSDVTPRCLAEVEAEAVALLCCEALELPGSDLCRGYIQAWWGQGNVIPEKSAQRILRVADQILRAGRADAEEGGR